MLLGFPQVSNAFIQSEVPGSATWRPGYPEKQKLQEGNKTKLQWGRGKGEVESSI